MNGERIWQGFSLTLAKKYDLSRIDKVIVDGDDASWVKKDANRMAKLICLSRMGKLDEGKRSCAKPSPALLKKEVATSQKKFQEGDSSDWLQADIPAFSGPHSDRPCVQVLRKLVFGDNRNVAYIGRPEIQPTKSWQ